MSALTITVPTDEAGGLSRKAVWHIAPLIGLLGLVAYFDRISVAFAGPQGMNEELGLTATTFGFAVGIFTLGYVLFEVASSGLLVRFGTKRWIVRIMPRGGEGVRALSQDLRATGYNDCWSKTKAVLLTSHAHPDWSGKSTSSSTSTKP